MSINTSIEWSDASWPVVRGCTKVSSGCDHCWAIQDAHLHAGSPNAKAAAHFQGLTQIVNGRPNWTGEVRLDESILDWPLRWRKPRRVFVASSGDLFHERLSCHDRRRIFSVMRDAPQHTYQLLTKRAEQMHGFAKWWVMAHVDRMPANWHLGVSVENQQTADESIPWLLRTPAAVRWVSYEPALGPVDFYRYLRLCTGYDHMHTIERGCWNKLDWIVIGGESGRGARPFDIAWARNVIAQCRQAEVPVFLKQLGSNPIGGCAPGETNATIKEYCVRQVILKYSSKGANMEGWPLDLRDIREFPRGFETPPGADPVQESGTK